MEQVSDGLRAWIEANAARMDDDMAAELMEIADDIDIRAGDEVAYAITQTRNDYEEWLDPYDAEHQRREYYDQGWSDAMEEKDEQGKAH